jgi:hypothetical protein
MRLGRFHQYALERKRYEIDYSQWLQSGEIIVDFALPSPAGLTIDSVSLAQADTMLIFFASGGVAGSSYALNVTIATSLDQTKRDAITIGVLA